MKKIIVFLTIFSITSYMLGDDASQSKEVAAGINPQENAISKARLEADKSCKNKSNGTPCQVTMKRTAKHSKPMVYHGKCNSNICSLD